MSDFIKADYSKNKENGFEPIPKGNYEMIIQSAQERATKSGAESLQLKLVVRNDLDGASELQKKYHNRIVFVDNWKRKATNQYDMQGFQYILNACKVPEGTDIPDVQAFMDIITRKPVLCYVTVRKQDYQGEEHKDNQIAPWGFSESKFPDVQHKFKNAESDPFANNSKPIDITDEDIPF